jgi:hypothetical protein
MEGLILRADSARGKSVHHAAGTPPNKVESLAIRWQQFGFLASAWSLINRMPQSRRVAL